MNYDAFNQSVITLLTFIALPLILAVAVIRQIYQYERGIKFLFGRFYKIMDPGWRIVIPVIQSFVKVDMRIKAVDVPDQEAITLDNVSVTINAVIYYRIVNAERAVIQVENYLYAMSQLAQTTMRNVVGEVPLDELLSKRMLVSERIQKLVNESAVQWGIQVSDVALKDIVLPDEMKRVIAKQAEAERERRAVIIKAEGERSAAENLAKAATMLHTAEGALHLRTLQAVVESSADKCNTIVFTVPLEILRSFEKWSSQADKKQG